MSINWFTLASLIGLVATGAVVIVLTLGGDSSVTDLIGVVGLGTMTITASVLSLHFKDD